MMERADRLTVFVRTPYKDVLETAHMIETLDMAKIISIDNGLIQDEEGCINNRDVCNKNFSQKFKNAQTILQD